MRSVRPFSIHLAVVSAAISVFITTLAATPALAQAPWWKVASSSQPTDLSPGGQGKIVVAATNLGDAEVNGAATPVIVTDKLPPGLTPTAISGAAGLLDLSGEGGVECALSSLSCTFTGSLPPYERLQVEITVEVDENAQSGPDNEATIAGGGAATASIKQPVTVSSAPISFGVERYEAHPYKRGWLARYPGGFAPVPDNEQARAQPKT